MEQDSDIRNETPAATVRRIAVILDAFLEAEEDLGVTDLAHETGMAKSVVHRFVTALTEAGYLQQTEGTRRYALGPKSVRLGMRALGRANIRQRALYHLRALAALTGETATLSLLVGDHRVYVEQIESGQRVRQTVELGGQAPLYAGASGKAMLAYLAPAERTAVLQQAAASSARRADGSPIDLGELSRELDEIRRRGYATSRSERILGAASAAAPVFDSSGTVVGCLSVAGVTVRQGSAELARFGEFAREAARRLSWELGWTERPRVESPPALATNGPTTGRGSARHASAGPSREVVR